MGFADSPTKTYSETRKRTSDSYLKFKADERVVARMLNPNARLVWKHWIAEANAGNGMMANCPNITAQTRVCPICAVVFSLPKDAEERKARSAKKRWLVNVLDRTPYTVCGSCEGISTSKKCTNCGADLKKNDFVPLNKVKLLEGGPQLFDQLNSIAQLQEQDYSADITEYDINFVTKGTGRDRKVNPSPVPPSPLDESALIDAETGEKQTLFNLDDLSEPTSIEEINLMLAGATMKELNDARGIA